MRVIATAGHVDHGKSTLVRALTGMEPDRWAEEQRRGMTIDLGYAWTALPSGETVAFVDVPGHVRFIGNMLAGLGASPAVLFVVAADEGWREQSAEHLAAIDGLGLRYGLLAVTRSDLADPGPALAQGRAALARSCLGEVEAVAVSGTTGAGIAELFAALERTVDALGRPVTDGRVRLWVDRAFTVTGAGTVVTGTLGSGSLAVGDVLDLSGALVRVRGLQCLGEPVEQVDAVARVAVNLRGVDRAGVGRGSVLLTPQAWVRTERFDAHVDRPVTDLPGDLVMHVGTAAVPAGVRPLGPHSARVTLARPVPLQVGDRVLLRDPGGQRLVGGLQVLDVDPPPLRRRGAAAARGSDLASRPRDTAAVVQERGAVRASVVRAHGLTGSPAPGVQSVGDWLVSSDRWEHWCALLVDAVSAHARTHPLEPGLPEGAALHFLGLPDPLLLAPVVRAAELEQRGGRVCRPGGGPALGEWLGLVQEQLSRDPFAAPDQDQLTAWGADRAELAAAAGTGALLILPGPVTLLPSAPAQAVELLAALPGPFTAGQARDALGTTRRVAIPLLEHLDRSGWTRRHPDARREVVPRAAGPPRLR